MIIEETIRNRASIKVFSQEKVAVEIIERCLDAAVWAPNHHLTEPWSFHVIMNDAREMLARMVEKEMVEKATGPNVPVAQAKAFKERQKLLSSPSIVAVYSAAGPDEKTTRENFAASAAAAQNILLMAQSMKISSIWRTSAIYELPSVRRTLQVHPDATFVGALFLGHSAQRTVKRRRTPASEKTVWLN